MEVGTMPYHWPADTDFALWELDVLDRDCPACGRMMYICDHRYRRFHTLDGPVELICKLNHCPDPPCPGHAKTKSPETRNHHRPAQAGRSAGTSSAGSGIDAVRATWSIPLIRVRTPGRLRDQALRRRHRQVHPTLPGHARRAAARPRGPPPALRRGRRDHPLDRRPPAREGTRDPLRRPGADPEAGLVRRAVALRDRGRGPTPDRQGQGVGRVPGQAGGPLDRRTSRTRS